MDSDKVIGIRLGLRPGQELLAGILVEVRPDVGARQRRATGRREVNLLGVQFAMDIRVREGMSPPR